MKTRLTILICCLAATLQAQEYKPLKLTLSRPLQLKVIDNSSGYTKTTYVQKNPGDTITLTGVNCHGQQITQVLTVEGYAYYNDFQGTVPRADADRFWNWVNHKDKEREPASEAEEEQERLQASMKMTAKTNTWHDYLTIFTGRLELNFSHFRLLDFLAEHMKMSEKSNDFSNGAIVSRCVERTSRGNPEYLTIKYSVKPEGDLLFPTRVEITGTKRRVIELFIKYWPTKIDFNAALKSGEYVCYMLPDKVTLKIDNTGRARITIVNSQ